jgi:hypothetical protein
MEVSAEKIIVNGISYIAEDAIDPPTGDRVLVVLDRGFVFVGQLSHDEDTGMSTISNAANVRRWEKGGFGGMTRSSADSETTIDPCSPIVFRTGSEIMIVSLPRDW